MSKWNGFLICGLLFMWACAIKFGSVGLFISSIILVLKCIKIATIVFLNIINLSFTLNGRYCSIMCVCIVTISFKNSYENMDLLLLFSGSVANRSLLKIYIYTSWRRYYWSLIVFNILYLGEKGWLRRMPNQHLKQHQMHHH